MGRLVMTMPFSRPFADRPSTTPLRPVSGPLHERTASSAPFSRRSSWARRCWLHATASRVALMVSCAISMLRSTEVRHARRSAASHLASHSSSHSDICLTPTGPPLYRPGGIRACLLGFQLKRSEGEAHERVRSHPQLDAEERLAPIPRPGWRHLHQRSRPGRHGLQILTHPPLGRHAELLLTSDLSARHAAERRSER